MIQPLSLATLPVAIGTYGHLILTSAKGPLWGISGATEEEMESIAVLVKLLPGRFNFLWKEVKDFLDNFFSHEEREVSEYGRRIARIVALTGWEIWKVRPLCCCNQADFEAKKALLMEWAELDPLMLDDDPDPSTASLLERDSVD